MLSAGSNNSYVKVLETQILDLINNIKSSIENYSESLSSKINSLKERKENLKKQYLKIPQNEKILRSIERELEIKEKLYLLLLQKREEASINLAVVKPSIKIIDYAKASLIPTNPKNIVYIACLLLGILIPISVILISSFF